MIENINKLDLIYGTTIQEDEAVEIAINILEEAFSQCGIELILSRENLKNFKDIDISDVAKTVNYDNPYKQ